MAEFETELAVALIRSHRDVGRSLPPARYRGCREHTPIPIEEAVVETFARIVETVLGSLHLAADDDHRARMLLRDELRRASTEDAGGSAWWP